MAGIIDGTGRRLRTNAFNAKYSYQYLHFYTRSTGALEGYTKRGSWTFLSSFLFTSFLSPLGILAELQLQKAIPVVPPRAADAPAGQSIEFRN
jgi:hypothetical protein